MTGAEKQAERPEPKPPLFEKPLAEEEWKTTVLAAEMLREAAVHVGTSPEERRLKLLFELALIDFNAAVKRFRAEVKAAI